MDNKEHLVRNNEKNRSLNIIKKNPNDLHIASETGQFHNTSNGVKADTTTQ